jgi:hypothetical protein
MSIGGSTSKTGSEQSSESQAVSTSTSGSSSRQNIAFKDLFANLFSGASNVAGRAVAGSDLQTAATQLFTGGMGFFDSLNNNAGTDYLEQRTTGGNPVLDAQIAGLEADTGRFFREEINPAITSRAVAGGNLGGGRQGIAQAQGAAAATREFTRGVTQLRVADQAQRDATAVEVARNSLGAASTGLGALPTLFDAAESSATGGGLGIYQTLAGILGGPTVLSESDSFSRSLSEAFSKSFGVSSGKSAGFNFGFGG